MAGMYRIRKSGNHISSATTGGIKGGIICMIVPLIMVGFICTQVTFNKLSDLIPFSPVLIFVFIGLLITLKESKYLKVKKYKINGGGIMERVKITAINVYHSHSDDSNASYPYYYAEAEKGDMIYCSEAYSKGQIGGTSIESLKNIYQSYGVTYDDNQSHKQELLQQIDRRISETQYEIENGGFLKKMALKIGSNFAETQRKIVEEGYQPPYWEINGHKISVGDTVDVYIDPNNPNNYRIDIDFLFDK